MLTATALRAEELITAKTRADVSAPGPREVLGAELRCWGRAVALRVPGLRELPPYNKVRGVSEDVLPFLAELTAFHTDAGIVPTLEVWAGDASERLGAALARRGLYAGTVTATLHRHPDTPRAVGPLHRDPDGGTATLHRDPDAPRAVGPLHRDPDGGIATLHRDPDAPRAVGPLHKDPDGVTVEELDPADDGTEYLATLVDGYGLAPASPERLAMLRAEHDPTLVRRYLARVDGRPAAAAAFYAHPEHGALFSGAATIPRYRRHGCQSALIARRLADAGTFAVATVAYGSASHANLERAGFRQTHTRTAWRPLRPAVTR